MKYTSKFFQKLWFVFLFHFRFYGSAILPPPSQPPPVVPGSLRVDAVVIGVAYAVALMSYKSSLNPARALGSAFVSSEDDR